MSLSKPILSSTVGCFLPKFGNSGEQERPNFTEILQNSGILTVFSKKYSGSLFIITLFGVFAKNSMGNHFTKVADETLHGWYIAILGDEAGKKAYINLFEYIKEKNLSIAGEIVASSNILGPHGAEPIATFFVVTAVIDLETKTSMNPLQFMKVATKLMLPISEQYGFLNCPDAISTSGIKYARNYQELREFMDAQCAQNDGVPTCVMSHGETQGNVPEGYVATNWQIPKYKMHDMFDAYRQLSCKYLSKMGPLIKKGIHYFRRLGEMCRDKYPEILKVLDSLETPCVIGGQIKQVPIPSIIKMPDQDQWTYVMSRTSDPEIKELLTVLEADYKKNVLLHVYYFLGKKIVVVHIKNDNVFYEMKKRGYIIPRGYFIGINNEPLVEAGIGVPEGIDVPKGIDVPDGIDVPEGIDVTGGIDVTNDFGMKLIHIEKFKCVLAYLWRTFNRNKLKYLVETNPTDIESVARNNAGIFIKNWEINKKYQEAIYMLFIGFTRFVVSLSIKDKEQILQNYIPFLERFMNSGMKELKLPSEIMDGFGPITEIEESTPKTFKPPILIVSKKPISDWVIRYLSDMQYQKCKSKYAFQDGYFKISTTPVNFPPNFCIKKAIVIDFGDNDGSLSIHPKWIETNKCDVLCNPAPDELRVIIAQKGIDFHDKQESSKPQVTIGCILAGMVGCGKTAVGKQLPTEYHAVNSDKFPKQSLYTEIARLLKSGGRLFFVDKNLDQDAFKGLFDFIMSMKDKYDIKIWFIVPNELNLNKSIRRLLVRTDHNLSLKKLEENIQKVSPNGDIKRKAIKEMEKIAQGFYNRGTKFLEEAKRMNGAVVANFFYKDFDDKASLETAIGEAISKAIKNAVNLSDVYGKVSVPLKVPDKPLQISYISVVLPSGNHLTLIAPGHRQDEMEEMIKFDGAIVKFTAIEIHTCFSKNCVNTISYFVIKKGSIEGIDMKLIPEGMIPHVTIKPSLVGFKPVESSKILQKMAASPDGTTDEYHVIKTPDDTKFEGRVTIHYATPKI